MPDNFLPVGDFERLQEILNRYHKNAIDRSNSTAKDDIEHVQKMCNKMYPAYYKFMMGDLVEAKK